MRSMPPRTAIAKLRITAQARHAQRQARCNARGQAPQDHQAGVGELLQAREAQPKPHTVPDWGLESRPRGRHFSFSAGHWPALPGPSAIQSRPSAGTSSFSPGQSRPDPRVDRKKTRSERVQTGVFRLIRPRAVVGILFQSITKAIQA